MRNSDSLFGNVHAPLFNRGARFGFNFYFNSAVFLFVALTFVSIESLCQSTTTSALKRLSMEELMDIEVTSVSRRPEKLTEVASAIQVITGEDIKRSAATTLPEALRLITNLQVAELNALASIISSRGFNAAFSNKLLVMIDGRTVYSPLFAGVFWDAQNLLLEDIERIEVVSGPGGTLWGANAVNGVINIITKHTKDTKGGYLSGAAGNVLQDLGSGRFGGGIGSTFSYRIFAQQRDRNATLKTNGTPNNDRLGVTQGGIRIDWTPSQSNAISLNANIYGGLERTLPGVSSFEGQNVMAKWSHTISEKSDFIVQAYVDRTWRKDIPSTISDELATYDIDLQHRFPVLRRHQVMWGAGYRFMRDKSDNATVFVGFVPKNRDMSLFNAFIQDEIMLIPDKFKLTLGTKLLHNVFTGFEFSPSGRLTWTPNDRHTVWSAVSWAVRTPSRIDVDYNIPTYPVPLSVQHVAGGPNFVSEKVIAYELGYRVQPVSQISLSLATFYNVYDDLYSVEALPGTLTYQIQNGTRGQSWGAELAGTYQVIEKWRLRGGYTYFQKQLENKPGHTYDYSALGNDPQHQFMVQSILDLPFNFQLDLLPRFVSSRPNPYIAAYFTFDARLAWVYKQLELSISGQNLWQAQHQEYTSNQTPRGFYGKITWRF